MKFVEFLDKILKVDLSSLSLAVPQTVTYHYTCHLRGLGVRDEGGAPAGPDGNVGLSPDGKDRPMLRLWRHVCR